MVLILYGLWGDMGTEGTYWYQGRAYDLFTKEDIIVTCSRMRRAGNVVHLTECLPYMHKGLSLVPRIVILPLERIKASILPLTTQ